MADLDALRLDRDVARAVRAERAWWRSLRADASRAADDWYEPIRHVTTRTTFQEVQSLPASDPLRHGLLAWMHRLALARIAQKQILAVALTRQEANLRWDEPEPGIYSVRNVVRQVLTSAAPPQGRAWLDALARSAVPLLDREKTLRQATEEITSRLGASDPSVFAPFDRATIVAEAEEFLRRTRDLASSFFERAEHLADLTTLVVARDVPGVWPTKPDARWLFDQFQGTPLLHGLSVDLGPTPSPLGGASFARALARLGAAYARVAVQGRAPFVVTTDPTELHPLRRGALFASLAVDPVFLRKQLGFSRDTAGSTSRAIVVTFLGALRLAAAQTVVDVANAKATTIAEATEDALRVPVPPELSAVFPRIDPFASRHFAAALLARSDGDELRGDFDDDWFRNPRALAALRERDAAPRATKAASDALRGAAEPLAKALEALAG